MVSDQPILRKRQESLSRLRSKGLKPGTVIDVGASVGTVDFTSLFPAARHIFIEPLEENAPSLKNICEKVESAEFVLAAASDTVGQGRLQVRPDLTYSGLIRADKEPETGLTLRTVPTVTVDNLVLERNLPGPFLLKVDVDGRELEVLQGAARTLRRTDCVIVEYCLSNRRSRKWIDKLWKAGFIIYDIIDPLFRPSDEMLWQVDLVFVRQRSLLTKGTQFYSEGAPSDWRKPLLSAVEEILND